MAVIRTLTAVLIIMFPVGLVLMILPQFSTKYLWTTNIFLGLQSVILFLLYREISSSSKALKLTSAVFLCSYLLELAGVNTGLPFGDYAYTSSMSPLIFGVPLSITFAWFSVSSTSFFLARMASDGKLLITVAGSAFLILAADILLEPFASRVNNFWIWSKDTVPVSNYVSWFIAGFLFSLLISKLAFNTGTIKKIQKPVYTYAVLIFFINILNFTIINLVNGFIGATAAGLSLILLVTAFLHILRTKHEA